MTELLNRCLADDAGAWEEIWAMIVPQLRRPKLRRLLAGVGDDSLVDDAEQDFYLFLREDACRRLRVFQGRDELAFQGYIVTVARNFLLSYRACRLKAEGRERGTLSIVARFEAEDPTESQLLVVLREFVKSLSLADQERLRWLLGLEVKTEAPPVGARTLRRWHRDLASLYRERVF